MRAGDRLPDLSLQNRIVQSSLLEDWTAPKHRVFGLNLDKDDIETMKHELHDAEVVAVATSDFYDEEGGCSAMTERSLSCGRMAM